MRVEKVQYERGKYFQCGKGFYYVSFKQENDGTDPAIRGKYMWALYQVPVRTSPGNTRISSWSAVGAIEYGREGIEPIHMGTFTRGTHAQEFARQIEFERKLDATDWVTPDMREAFAEAIVADIDRPGDRIFARLNDGAEISSDFEDGEVFIKRVVEGWHTYDGKHRVSSICLRFGVRLDGQPDKMADGWFAQEMK